MYVRSKKCSRKGKNLSSFSGDGAVVPEVDLVAHEQKLRALGAVLRDLLMPERPDAFERLGAGDVVHEDHTIRRSIER